MTLAELLTFLDTHTDYGFLHGDVAATLSAAADGSHPNAIPGAIVKALDERLAQGNIEAVIERAGTITALGPLRLTYMADDAPVEGFRMVERTITMIDEAFNQEALRAKGQ
ncbi:hypothetical protein SAMN05216526_1565 [Ectothiorhodosinus mongolicus]|uniref:Uncharacterized protein n=1 Tax=Ectothiorhodosinus mongolicus TaxID=233100 RepID=A0A1R3W2T2_9GAMM|nr:hypothetical protein [Ectothiorhodosinus mongolicus]ULX57414.1 hypothetical protein CKX93_06835 [Ectothiorhodosinus mongolicus]SIT72067.1 hypothetical protein SAMN05216526_1565 [Ectothiorhodosinus mongolicus]